MTGIQKALRGVGCRDLRDTLKGLNEEGWDVERTGGGHLKLTHEKAYTPVFSAVTPSDFRGRKNLVAECSARLQARPSMPVASTAIVAPEQRSGPAELQRKKKPRWGHRKKLERNTMADTMTSQEKDTARQDVKAVPEASPVAPEQDVAGMSAAPREPDVQTSPAPADSGVHPVDFGGLPVTVIATDVMALAMRILRGEVRTIEITADMVGARMVYEGDVSFIVDGNGGAENSGGEKAAPAPTETPASGNRKSGKASSKSILRERIIKVIETLNDDWLTMSEIVDLLETADIYNTPASINFSMRENLASLCQEGVVERRRDKGENGFRYRRKAG